MSRKSLVDFTETSSIRQNDILIVVKDPSGASTTNKITANNMFADINYLSANVFTINLKTTPANNSNVPTGAEQGTIFFDSDYIYVVTTSGVIKRASLSIF